MPTRRRVLAAGLAALAAPRISRAQARSTIRFVPQGDPPLLDPIPAPAIATRNHALLVYDTLYGVDEHYRPQPQMVEGHVAEADGRLWRLTLREGLRFHDGEPVLARDAVASVQRWGKRDGFGQTLMAATDELSAPDDRTVQFRLKQPFPRLPAALGKSGVAMPAIMPARLAATEPTRPAPEIVGSGPFRFLPDERVAGSRMAHQRFDGYLPRPSGMPSFMAGPKRALVERVEWQIIPDPSTAAAALQAGEVDWVELPSPDVLPLLRRARDVVVAVKNTAGSYAVMRPNHLHPPFDNPGVRRAVMGAIAQADFMTVAAGSDRSIWRDRVGFFHPDSPMASDVGMEALNGPRDYDAVRRALEQAGYRGETAVMLNATDIPAAAAMSVLAADMFGKIGLTLDLQNMDFGTQGQRLASQEPVERRGWSVICTWTDGANTFNPAAHTYLRGTGRMSNLGWPTSPALEAMRSAWLTGGDDASEPRTGREMQAQAFQDVPYWPLGIFLQPTAHRASLTGILNGAPVFYNVAKG